MATERLLMRHIREILRLKWTLNRSHRETARSLGVSPGAVASVMSRATRVGLTWDTLTDLTDEFLKHAFTGRRSPAESPARCPIPPGCTPRIVQKPDRRQNRVARWRRQWAVIELHNAHLRARARAGTRQVASLRAKNAHGRTFLGPDSSIWRRANGLSETISLDANRNRRRQAGLVGVLRPGRYRRWKPQTEYWRGTAIASDSPYSASKPSWES